MYKNLIERDVLTDGLTFFNKKILPKLKPNTEYFKAYIVNDVTQNKVLGYGINCRLYDFEIDIKQWFKDHPETYGYCKVYIYKVLEDGKTTICCAHKYI